MAGHVLAIAFLEAVRLGTLGALEHLFAGMCHLVISQLTGTSEHHATLATHELLDELEHS